MPPRGRKRNILARGNVEALRQVAWSNVLIGLDYDGTLAPIVSQPEQAHMRARTRRLLAEVVLLYPCAIISGRGRPDLLRRLQGVGRIDTVGNHGIEPGRDTPSFTSEVRRWVRVLQRRLAGLRGVVIEDKVFSLSIHYRHSRARRAARAAIEDALALIQPARVIGGKLVYNVLPPGAPHKGMALLAARERYRCDAALYIGDDDTDEDVFSLEDPGRLLSIRVGASATSRASYFIRTQRDIDAVLEIIVSCGRERQVLKRDQRRSA
jgi:trehalose 6-phosphate phosphatase